MHRLCCVSSGEVEAEISVVEAIEMIYERMRQLGIDIGKIESQMRIEAKRVHFYVGDGDKEQARVHMRRIKGYRQRRTRVLGCREQLHQMKENLSETALYGSVQETFRQGLQVTDALLQRVDIGQIETMMDRLDDVAAETNELGTLLGESSIDVDDDIETELQQLMIGVVDDCEEIEIEKETEQPTTVSMPNVPTNSIKNGRRKLQPVHQRV